MRSKTLKDLTITEVDNIASSIFRSFYGGKWWIISKFSKRKNYIWLQISDIRTSWNFNSTRLKRTSSIRELRKEIESLLIETAKMTKKQKAIIVDIDGTVCEKHEGRGIYEWRKLLDDHPVPHVIETVNLYREAGYKILFVTGRDGICFRLCEKWLEKNIGDFRDLFTREVNDRRPDDVVKKEIYEEQIEPFYDVRLALDDRDRVVKLWRSLGIPCYQVKEEEY